MGEQVAMHSCTSPLFSLLKSAGKGPGDSSAAFEVPMRGIDKQREEKLLEDKPYASC